MTALRMPRIGRVFRSSEGTYDVGPIPDVGGPFETATEFFQAWAAQAKFPTSEETMRKMIVGVPEDLVEELLSSIRRFPGRLQLLAGVLSAHDKGPFPIYHPDLMQHNVIVDDDFDVLGVIDWQGTYTVPWELVQPPLFFRGVPQAMDAPWNYDKHGQPVDADITLAREEQAEYLQMVKAAEIALKRDTMLSSNLANPDVQGLAYAIKVYNDGKQGLYDGILEPFQVRQLKQERMSKAAKQAKL
jgi:hypothetical protein